MSTCLSWTLRWASRSAFSCFVVNAGIFEALLGVLSDLYDAMDECHVTGFLGATGHSTEKHCGVEVDIVSSTLSKSPGPRDGRLHGGEPAGG